MSSDFNHNPASSIFDSGLTRVSDGTLVKVSSWYDNEWGFSNRMLDVAAVFAEVGPSLRSSSHEVQAHVGGRPARQAGLHPLPTSTSRSRTGASPTTRASAPRCRPSSTALEQGAAVMVTSHLGRPKEGELKPEDSLAPVAKRLSELLKRDVPLIQDWVERRRGEARPGGDAGELPRQQGREEGRRGARAQDRGAVRRLRERRLRHRAPRRGHHARRGALRQGRVRRAADGGGARCARQGARRSERGRWSRSSAAPRSRPSSPCSARWRRRSTA